jgi:hypothetical protein
LPDETAQILALAAMGQAAEQVTIIAGTSRGLFISRDGGRVWLPAEGDLGGLPIVAVAPSPRFADDRCVWVLVVGGELWQYVDN